MSLLGSVGSELINPDSPPGPFLSVTLALVQRSIPRAPPLPVEKALIMLTAPWQRAWPTLFTSSPLRYARRGSSASALGGLVGQAIARMRGRPAGRASPRGGFVFYQFSCRDVGRRLGRISKGYVAGLSGGVRVSSLVPRFEPESR